MLSFPHDSNPKYSTSLNIGAYSLYVDRLEYPYTDDCLDFSKCNFPNRYTAIYSCFVNRENETKLHLNRLVTENDKDLLKYKPSIFIAIPQACECLIKIHAMNIQHSHKYCPVGSIQVLEIQGTFSL